MSSATVQPGDTIADKYRIERLIGEGGMGSVYSARHLQLDQMVAIKFLLGRDVSDQASQRFRREARAAARIRSEHVCRVLDVGELPDGTPYMVMEYLEGCDLAEELAKRQRLPVAEAAGLVLQACEALAEAHMAGIIHRDIKPGNLFLARRPIGAPMLKVLDFGISKMVDPGAGLALTSTMMQMGSPLYMSPEQIDSSKDVDARTDVWSLGVVLYELVAGRPPFVADTMPQLIHAMMHLEPPPLSDLGVEAPNGFEALVTRTLKRDRTQRVAGVAEFAAQLADFAEVGDRASAARIAALAAASTIVDSGRASTLDVPDRAATGRGSAVPTGHPSTTTAPLDLPAGVRTFSGRRWSGLVLGALSACTMMALAYWLGTREPSAKATSSDAASEEQVDTASTHSASTIASPGAEEPQSAMPNSRAMPDAAVPQASPSAVPQPALERHTVPARHTERHREPAHDAPAAPPHAPAAPTSAGDGLPDFGGRR